MPKATTLDGPRQEPASGGPAEQLILLLHGLGADGNDLIPLAPIFQQVMPNAAFVAPHAPDPSDVGQMGRQWFSLKELTPEALLAGAQAVAPALDAFIDQERDRYDLPDGRVAILGFSQGSMMGLFVGLRRERQLAAIAAFSGLLIGPELLASELRSRPPVLLVHGQDDEIVPFQAMDAAEKALRHYNVPVVSHARPGLGHSIDEEGIRQAATLLLKSFGVKRTAPGQDAAEQA